MLVWVWRAIQGQKKSGLVWPCLPNAGLEQRPKACERPSAPAAASTESVWSRCRRSSSGLWLSQRLLLLLGWVGKWHTMVLWAYYYRPGLTDGASVKAVEAAMKVTEAIIASAESWKWECLTVFILIIYCQFLYRTNKWWFHETEERIINTVTS